MLIGDILVSNARRFPDKIGIIDERSAVTWREVNLRVNGLSNYLLGLGLKIGDRVGIICENCQQYVETLFATAKIGLIHVNINYRLPQLQIASLLNFCEPKAVIIQNKYVPVINSIRSELRSVEFYVGIGYGHDYPYDFEYLIKESPSTEPEANIAENDYCAIIFSSGTTGVPKAALSTHKNWIHTCMISALISRLTPRDIEFLPGPLFAAAGQIRLMVAIYQGASVAACTFKAETFCQMVEKYGITVFNIRPVTYQIIRDFFESREYKYNLNTLHKLQCGGGQGWNIRQLEKMLGFFNADVFCTQKVYGFTESCGAATALLPEEIAAALSPNASERDVKRLESVGKPLLDSRIRLVDENGCDVPAGETGEILYKGGNLINRFWNRPDLDIKLLKDGWFHTGDFGKIDEDGYLYIIGRKDFMIKTGGFNVYPEEVERVISTHPAVRQVGVIGVPDETWGQAVTAFVSLQPGYSTTEEEIKTFCRKKLASFQLPKSIHFMEELPIQPSLHKISHQELLKIWMRSKT